jgi:hypothetical protein
MELLRTFRLDWRHLVLIVAVLLVAVSTVHQQCSAAAANNKPKASTGDVDYQYQYKDYQDEKHSYSYSQVQSYDYGQQVPQEPPDTSILCYTCEYEFIATDNHIEGTQNCKDRFNPVDIPEIKCKGPCSKKYMKMGEKNENSFRLVRSCLPNCKDRADDTSYTQCCTKKLCNGYSTFYALRDHRWVLLLSCICALIIARL